MKRLKLVLFMCFFACLSCQTQMDGDKDEELPKLDPEETVDPEVMVDPEAAAIMEKLLGKWELFRVSYSYDPSVQCQWDVDNPYFPSYPNGYVEYLPDGSFKWYDYGTQEYISYERKFWVDHVVNPPNSIFPDIGKDPSISDGWVLHYEPFLVYYEEWETDLVYQYFSDKPDGTDFCLSFINQDTIRIEDILMKYHPGYYFFYKRIN